MKRIFFIKLRWVYILFVFFIGVLWWNECRNYQKEIYSSILEGTILTWKSGKSFKENHILLLNPNEVSDYVEFDFHHIKENLGIDVIYTMIFDGMGFYLLTGSNEQENNVQLLYVSESGTQLIQRNLMCKDWGRSGFIPSKDSLYLKMDQFLYKIDTQEKAIHLVKDFGENKVIAYPYQNGIVYQWRDEIKSLTDKGENELCFIPHNMNFDGWYDMGTSILLSNLNRETYIMDLQSGQLQRFADFLFVNYGTNKNGLLLELMPKGGGGATPFDTIYTPSVLLGNDAFTAFTVSIYNKETQRIKNIYYSDNDVTSCWLDIPYNKKYFEKIAYVINHTLK